MSEWVDDRPLLWRLRNESQRHKGCNHNGLLSLAAREIERLRALLAEIDALHHRGDWEGMSFCHECDGSFWPCRSYRLLHPEEARRG